MQDTQFFMRHTARVNLRHAACLTNLRRAAFLIALALPWLGISAARADQAPDGWWLNKDGTAAILIAPCGAQTCGRVEWLKKPLDAVGNPKTDIHNPDPSLRARPVCGMVMLGGFVPDGSGGWEGGWVYDPKAGKTYKAVMHMDGGNLVLHGYIGVPLFGRSETMTRPAAALTPCAPAASG